MAPKFTGTEDELLISQIEINRVLWDMEEKDYKDFTIKENIWKEIAKVVNKSVKDCKQRWKSMRDNYLKCKKSQKLGTGSASYNKPVKWALYKHLSFIESAKQERSSTNTLSQLDSSNDWDESDSIREGEEETETQDATLSVEDIFDSVEVDKDLCVTPISATNSRKRQIIDDLKNSESSRCSTPTTISGGSRKKGSTNTVILQEMAKRQEERAELLKGIAGSIQKEDDDVDSFMKSIAMTVKTLPPDKIARAKLEILTIVTNLQFPQESTSTPLPVSRLYNQPTLYQSTTPTHTTSSFLYESTDIINL